MKKITAVLAVIIVAFSVTGCLGKKSDSTRQIDDSTSDFHDGSNNASESAKQDDSQKGNAVSDNPIVNAENVLNQYMKYANFEFNESMLKLMTPTMQKQYKETIENQAHDHAYDEHEEDMLTEVSFVADKDKSIVLESVNIPEEYLTAVELFGNVYYKNKGEEASDDGYAIVVEVAKNDWKIAYVGTKSHAYLSGIISDNESQKADNNAKVVYEAAEKAYDSIKDDYDFKYMNYICTEKDKFVEEIKKNLSDDLKDTYFTVFMADGKLDYVLWSEENGSEVVVKYPS